MNICAKGHQSQFSRCPVCARKERKKTISLLYGQLRYWKAKAANLEAINAKLLGAQRARRLWGRASGFQEGEKC